MPITDPRDVVVVPLGAGASRDAGLRLAAELTQDLQADLEASKNTLLQRTLGLILGSVAFRRGFEGRMMHAPVDIESVLAIAQTLARRNEHALSAFVASWHAFLEEIGPKGNGSAFDALIREARGMLRTKLQTPSDGTALKYLESACRLSEAVFDDDSPEVFTLNYDRCVESALGYQRRKFTTGFKDGLWDPREFELPGRVRLYKLHGSFGWLRDPESGLLYDRDQALGRDDIDIFSEDTDDDLIFGADNKFSPRQPYLWLVYRFVQALERCPYVVTVGYGFRDVHINQALAQAMAADPKKDLLVVGPGLSQKDLDGPCESRFYPERTTFIGEGAKRALFEQDTILKKLRELEQARAEVLPFD